MALGSSEEIDAAGLESYHGEGGERPCVARTETLRVARIPRVAWTGTQRVAQVETWHVEQLVERSPLTPLAPWRSKEAWAQMMPPVARADP